MTTQIASIERFPTGIEGLDIITSGGLLVAGVYIVQGVPGAGKTILANEVCFRHIASGGRAVYVTLLAESHSRMLQHLRNMEFFDESVIPDRLFYMSAFRTLEDEGLKGLLALLRREMRAQKVSLLVLDGLVAAEESAPSPREFKKFIHELQSHAAANGCTVLLLTTGAGGKVSAEHTMVDGLIELADEQNNMRNQRTLQVRKFRGSPALRGKHVFRITQQGIRLFPRIEARFSTPLKPDPGHGPPISTGTPDADRLMQGGVSRSSVTGLAGPTGVGKTLFTLAFLSQSGPCEPGLMFTFYETPRRLIEKAAGIGHDLSGLVEEGHLQILWHSQGEHLIDELAHDLLRAVRERGVKRLVIDGLGGLIEAAPDPERISRFMACLMEALRSEDVATLITVESREIVGSAVKMPVDGMSAIVDNLVFMRFVEREAMLGRMFSIIKKRNGDHDHFIREMRISSEGFRIGEPMFGFEAATTGVARSSDPAAATAHRTRGK